MDTTETCNCTAFEGSRRIASGDLAEVALAAKAAIDRGATEPVLIFDHRNAEIIEVDFRGSADDVHRRLRQRAEGEAATAEPEASKRPGRPKLGVIGREVTLLPRHWDWLNGQPGGASVALRKAGGRSAPRQ